MLGLVEVERKEISEHEALPKYMFSYIQPHFSLSFHVCLLLVFLLCFFMFASLSLHSKSMLLMICEYVI